MKKFSNKSISNSDKEVVNSLDNDKIFKYKIMDLMNEYLKVQMYGPITRYHVAGTMKVVGKELFVEALMDLLSDKDSKEIVSVLESLKENINDWESIDRKIDEVSNKISLSDRKKIEDLYWINISNKDLVIESFKISSCKIKSKELVLKRYNAAKSLLENSKYDKFIIGKIAEIYLNRYNELKSISK